MSLSTRVSPRSSERLRAYAERTGKSLSEALDEMLGAALSQAPFAEHDELAGLPLSEGYQEADRQVEVGLEELRASYERLQAECRRVARQEAFMRGVFEHLPVAVAYADGQQVLRLVNRAWAMALGGMPGDFVGTHASRSFPTADDALQALLDQVQASGEPWQAYDRPWQPGGDARSLWDTAVVPLPLESGSPPGLLAVASDVTRRGR